MTLSKRTHSLLAWVIVLAALIFIIPTSARLLGQLWTDAKDAQFAYDQAQSIADRLTIEQDAIKAALVHWSPDVPFTPLTMKAAESKRTQLEDILQDRWPSVSLGPLTLLTRAQTIGLHQITLTATEPAAEVTNILQETQATGWVMTNASIAAASPSRGKAQLTITLVILTEMEGTPDA